MNIEKKHLEKKFYLGKTAEVKISELQNNHIFAEVYQAVGTYLGESGQSPIISAALYKTWEPENDKTELMPAFSVSEGCDPGEFELYTVPEGDAYVGIHKGSYTNLGESHQAMMDHVANEGAKMGGVVLEEYVVYPDEGVEEKDYETRLVYYIQ